MPSLTLRSGVLSESLARSRHRWINEGLFEKYWTKPYKRKGLLHEDPKNPPKDSMTKVGTVIITVEPHIIEATMFAVKASKLPPPQDQKQSPGPSPKPLPQQKPPPPPPRPVLQYGPPNGSMPPPPTPALAVAASPSPAPAKPLASPGPATTQVTQSPAPTPQAPPRPLPTAALSSASPGSLARPSPAPSPVPPAAAPHSASRSFSNPPQRPAPTHAPPNPSQAPGPSAAAAPSPTPTGAKPGPAKPTANDPVIALLAQKASGDQELRDLMKRVAIGQAKEGELAKFQKIIDQLNAEYKSRGGQQGPSADRLLVDGRTVKYFADEVRTILDIVLASNPNQKSSELRPPPRSDPLVVLLVKTALEDQRTKDMIRRIAEGRPGFTDAQDLKEILDRLHRDAKTVPKNPAPPPPSPAARQPTPNGVPNSQQPRPAVGAHAQQANAQALRSKGPPPPARPDISAVVFDFGSGDRYLFPKFSVLEFLPSSSGQQVVASFLIVRKGSTSEYGGDPALDYYQPVTIRLHTTMGKHLENLARVVAPQDEVRRYMDDVMDNMTRAEYVLLAMRLPRAEQDGVDADTTTTEDKGASTPRSDPEPEGKPAKPGVLWTAGSSKPADTAAAVKFRDPEQEAQSKYERLIRSVAEKETEAV